MTITAGLATVLVAQLGLAPAIAGVVATIVIGKAAPASVQAICAIWAAKAGYASPTATSPGTPAPAGTATSQ